MLSVAVLRGLGMPLRGQPPPRADGKAEAVARGELRVRLHLRSVRDSLLAAAWRAGHLDTRA